MREWCMWTPEGECQKVTRPRHPQGCWGYHGAAFGMCVGPATIAKVCHMSRYHLSIRLAWPKLCKMYLCSAFVWSGVALHSRYSLLRTVVCLMLRWMTDFLAQTAEAAKYHSFAQRAVRLYAQFSVLGASTLCCRSLAAVLSSSNAVASGTILLRRH